jgi:hypothetical protein
MAFMDKVLARVTRARSGADTGAVDPDPDRQRFVYLRGTPDGLFRAARPRFSVSVCKPRWLGGQRGWSREGKSA